MPTTSRRIFPAITLAAITLLLAAARPAADLPPPPQEGGRAIIHRAKVEFAPEFAEHILLLVRRGATPELTQVLPEEWHRLSGGESPSRWVLLRPGTPMEGVTDELSLPARRLGLHDPMATVLTVPATSPTTRVDSLLRLEWVDGSPGLREISTDYIGGEPEGGTFGSPTSIVWVTAGAAVILLGLVLRRRPDESR